MNAPQRPPREFYEDAPVPVQRRKRNLLRRHWLTGAFICGVVVIMGRSSAQLYQTETKLQDVRVQHKELDARIDEARQRGATLQAELDRAGSAANLEVRAKQLGFIHPDETVYQKGK
ncbi:MAG TPA: septum formation initiator family protein [Symbiobacteriaceae bacterium]|jgi:cell division protein FtsB